jgi:hypothetical protein
MSRIAHWFLPIGVIASIGPDGRESDIQDVEDLVGEFIKDPHCLILLAISCESWYYPFKSLFVAEGPLQRTLKTNEVAIWSVNSTRRGREPFVSLN